MHYLLLLACEARPLRSFREILFKPMQFEPFNSKSSSRSLIDWFAAPEN